MIRLLVGLLTILCFVDSDGSKITGRASVQKAWSQYFSLSESYQRGEPGHCSYCFSGRPHPRGDGYCHARRRPV
jgi:hypothetical protein